MRLTRSSEQERRAAFLHPQITQKELTARASRILRNLCNLRIGVDCLDCLPHLCTTCPKSTSVPQRRARHPVRRVQVVRCHHFRMKSEQLLVLADRNAFFTALLRFKSLLEELPRIRLLAL